MDIKCGNCVHLKKRHKTIDDEEYFRMCLETEEYMSISDAEVLHNCKGFQSLPRKQLLSKIREARLQKQLERKKRRREVENQREKKRLEKEELRKKQKVEKEKQEQERLKDWRTKMKSRRKR